jgi:Zn-dependent M16 (insulinase) family peptidase
MTENHKSDFIRQTENFVINLPKATTAGHSRGTSAETPDAKNESRKTFVTTQFPVHYCALALPTVPYTHEDSAPLRILAKLLTAKFLLPEIREKGGAYGAGAASNPSSGTLKAVKSTSKDIPKNVLCVPTCTIKFQESITSLLNKTPSAW